MNADGKNPYVGPRTFQKDDRDLFFGRDREAHDLMALLCSERLILFYAQSGAGKSSLLNARLIPELEENHFEVLPMGRIQGDLVAERDVENIYVYNLMSSIVQQKMDPRELESTSLSQFLSVLNLNDGSYVVDQNMLDATGEVPPMQRVLIIDQFEELFTTNLDAWKRREGFFRQLAQAMKDDPSLTVMLVMREDYIASLDLYAHLLPGGLRTRYYMQRLTRDMALKAVRNPVETARPFAAGVAEKLVEDLASILIHRAADVQEVHSGQYVEPVQLQVVCYSLWESLPPEGCQITLNDLVEVGDVDQTLERFYDQRVAAVATESDVPERVIREWFGEKLITGTKTRNLVLQKNSRDGLRDDVIQALRGDLVREELRTGQIWYELSHDRLIEPVLSSNAKWFEQHLSMFQRRVVLWSQQGRTDDSLLLRGKELEAAEREATALTLTLDEQEFLKACRVLEKRQRRDKIQRRIIGIALVVALMLLVTTVFFYQASRASLLEAQTSLDKAVSAEAKAKASEAEALRQMNIAEEQRGIAEQQQKNAELAANKALAGSLAAQAEAIKNSDHGLALLLGLDAYQREDSLLTRTNLFKLLQFSPYIRLFGFDRSVTSIDVSPDGTWAAISSSDQISILDMRTKQLIPPLLNPALINSLAINDKGTLLAAGGYVNNDNLISLWDVQNPKKPQMLEQNTTGHTQRITSLAFSPDGNYLASASHDRTVILWDISSREGMLKVSMLSEPGPHEAVLSLAFSPDGRYIVSGEADGALHLWNISVPSTPQWLEKLPAQQAKAIYAVAFSGDLDTVKFASASDDKTVVLWDWDPASHALTNPLALQGHNGYVRSVGFGPNGTTLASADFDGQIMLWSTKTGEQIGPALRAHDSSINVVAFGNEQTQNVLLSGGNDSTVVVWDLSTRQPLSQPVHDAPPALISDTAEGIQASAHGQQIVLLKGVQETNTLAGHTGAVNSLSFSPARIDDRLLLASASDDQTVIVWDVTSVKDANVFLKLDGFNHPVTSAYFSEDGTRLYIESDGQSTEWIIAPQQWEALVCEIMKSNLIDAAQEEYRNVCE